MKFLHLVVLFFLLMLLNCTHGKKSKIITLFKERIGTILDLPLHNETDTFVNKFKFVVYIDGDCSECVNDFLKWKELSMKFKNMDISYLFYVYTQNKNILEQQLALLCFDLPYIVDKYDSFIKRNSLPFNKHAHVFLINNNRKIILMGNPILEPNLVKLYLNEINK